MKNGVIVETIMISRTERIPAFSIRTGFSVSTGAVITEVGDDPKVAGLVYVAAYVPDPGTSANDTSAPFGPTPWQSAIQVDPHHFASMSREVFSTALQKVCRWPSGGWFSRYKARSTAQCSMRS